MKILLVAPQPYYVERGTPIAVRQLARTLAAQGHDVVLLAYPLGNDPGDAGVQVQRCMRIPWIRHMPIGFSFAKLLYDIPLSLSILRARSKYRADVVHAVEEAIYPSLLLKAFTRVKVVYDMDSSLADQLVSTKPALSFLKGILVRLEHWAMRKSDSIAAVCDELADDAKSVVPPSRVHTLYDIPNDEQTDDGDDDAVEDLRQFAGDGQKIGLYVGNLEAYQGIDLLLDAIQLLPEDTALKSIVVGGNDAHIAQYREKARALGVDGRIVFIGPRPLKHLSRLLPQADILYSPRITGGNTPMKLYSYMASGRPVVATALSTHSQVLSAESAALAEATAPAYSAAIKGLVDDDALSAALAAEALRLVDEKYSAKNYANTVSAIYAGL